MTIHANKGYFSDLQAADYHQGHHEVDSQDSPDQSGTRDLPDSHDWLRRHYQANPVFHRSHEFEIFCCQLDPNSKVLNAKGYV